MIAYLNDRPFTKNIVLLLTLFAVGVSYAINILAGIVLLMLLIQSCLHPELQTNYLFWKHCTDWLVLLNIAPWIGDKFLTLSNKIDPELVKRKYE
jgi:hypothetical protein